MKYIIGLLLQLSWGLHCWLSKLSARLDNGMGSIDQLAEEDDYQTEYEQQLEALYEETGVCHCNLCQAMHNKNRENITDD